VLSCNMAAPICEACRRLLEAVLLTIFFVYALMGLLLAGLSVPLILSKVRPNIWYGFRTRLTLDNPDVWYPVNAWAGRRMLLTGLAAIVAGLAGLLVPGKVLRLYASGLAVLLIVSVSLILAFGVRYARRLRAAQG